MILGVHHIGYLVSHIDKAREAFESLAYSACTEQAFFDADRLCHFLFMTQAGSMTHAGDTAQAGSMALAGDMAQAGSMALAGSMLQQSCDIELIAPTQESSPVWGLYKKFRNRPYHMCYKTDDIDLEIERLLSAAGASGYMLIQPPARALAISPTAVVAFLMNSDIGMIELLEEKEVPQ